MVIALLIVVVAIVIVVAVMIFKYVSKKNEERQQKEQEEREFEENKRNEGIEIAKDIIEQTYESQYNFLNKALLSDSHYFSYFECEKFKSDTNELH